MRPRAPRAVELAWYLVSTARDLDFNPSGGSTRGPSSPAAVRARLRQAPLHGPVVLRRVAADAGRRLRAAGPLGPHARQGAERTHGAGAARPWSRRGPMPHGGIRRGLPEDPRAIQVHARAARRPALEHSILRGHPLREHSHRQGRRARNAAERAWATDVLRRHEDRHVRVPRGLGAVEHRRLPAAPNPPRRRGDAVRAAGDRGMAAPRLGPERRLREAAPRRPGRRRRRAPGGRCRPRRQPRGRCRHEAREALARNRRRSRRPARIEIAFS